MDERSYLRELAKKYLDYAHSKEMEIKETLWYAHNDFQSRRSPIVMEIDTFLNDILPPGRCESKYGKEIERYLQYYIVNHELIRDDKVIPKEYRVPLQIDFKLFDLDMKREQAAGGEGIGFHIEPAITDLEEQVYGLKKSTYFYDREETEKHYAYAEMILGDLMPVTYENQSLRWQLTPTQMAVDLMTMQEMFMAMYDCPDEFHLLMEKITNELIEYCLWQEKEGLLTWNGGNQYVGAGSYGFTKQLKQDSPCLRDMWGNTNSQESVGISPEMYEEFIAPYYRKLSGIFGAMYYGCCEPANEVWDSIKTYPNLKKVSVSAWADQEFMGKVLAEQKIIYSRKPSPNFIGAPNSFDDKKFEAYMEETFRYAKDCQLEIIFRDIYTLGGDLSKPGRAVEITRNLEKRY